MIRSFFSAVTAIFNKVEDTANTLGSTIDMANSYVENRKIKFQHYDQQRCAVDLAKDLEELTAELEEDENLEERYEECMKLFDPDFVPRPKPKAEPAK